MNKFWVLLIGLAFFHISDTVAQGEVDEETRIFYRNERTFSGNLYSNGWSANFRYAFRRNATRSYLIDADIAGMRHPKEYRSQSPYLIGWGRTFVFGKLNEAFMIRGAAGLQRELFRKFDRNSISIRYFANAGLSLGFLKPIYYLKVIGFDPATYDIITDESPFDPDFMQSVYDIYDKKSFFRGIGEMKVNPGAFARLGVCFEFSDEDERINALEGGVQVEGFLRKMEIMASQDNRQLFVTVFVGYRLGRVIDARY